MLAAAVALCFSLGVEAKTQQKTVELMQILNGTNNYYTQTSHAFKKAEAEWIIKRHRMLAGDMTAEERELYVSKNKAPIFIIGTMKGTSAMLGICIAMCMLNY